MLVDVDYRRLTLAKLTFLDFVYFSVGAATTATFCDIAPNHCSIRLLVSSQVLLSIVMVGFVVNDLNRRRAGEGGGSAVPAYLRRCRFTSCASVCA